MRAGAIFFTALAMAFAATAAKAAGGVKRLVGTPIGAPQAASPAGGPQAAFDNDKSTFYASEAPSGGWVGLDLGRKCVVTRVAYVSRKGNPDGMLLGLFEGANNPDFTDAVPLMMITKTPADNIKKYTFVNVSRGFRYVRYVGPDASHCDAAEIEFHGREGEGDDSKFYTPTNLPLVVVHTRDAEPVTTKSEYLKGIVSVISDGGGRFFSDSVEIKGRGNGSWTFPKKPYKIKLARKRKLLGMPSKARKWTLINNWSDKALMRNAVAFKISGKMGMDYVPACRFVDVMLNGEYKGTFQLCDQVEVREGRVELAEMTAADETMPNLSGGYFVEIDGYAAQERWSFTTSSYSLPVTIKYPDDGDITRTQYNYIKNAFEKLATRVAGNFYKNPDIGLRKFLDAEAFVKHILVSEFCANADAYWSMFMYKARDSTRFRTGPVWDFDLAIDNDYRVHPLNTFVYEVGASSNAGDLKGFVARVMEAEEELACEVWSKARRSRGLDMNYINAVIDSMENELRESQALNFTRWPIMNTLVQFEYKCAGSYEGEVEVLRDFLARRMEWMDNRLELLTTDAGDATTLAARPEIIPEEGGIGIAVTGGEAVAEVCGVDGSVRARVETVSGKAFVALGKGIYIVSVGTGGSVTRRKVSVR